MTRRLLAEDVRTSSVLRTQRFSFRSRFAFVCENACASSPTRHSTSHCSKTNAFPFPEMRASCVCNPQCISFRRALHISNESDSISGPAKLARLLPARAASKNVGRDRDHVKQFVSPCKKNVGSSDLLARARPLMLVRYLSRRWRFVRDDVSCGNDGRLHVPGWCLPYLLDDDHVAATESADEALFPRKRVPLARPF